jgi:hypothetical protein
MVLLQYCIVGCIGGTRADVIPYFRGMLLAQWVGLGVGTQGKGPKSSEMHIQFQQQRNEPRQAAGIYEEKSTFSILIRGQRPSLRSVSAVGRCLICV